MDSWSGFETTNDPMREIFGSMFESNPDEVKDIVEELENIGVKVQFRKGKTMAYQPICRGKPGQIVIDEEASYSALLHERRHALDDLNSGWNGIVDLFEFPKNWIYEKNAYNEEINYAKLNNVDKKYIIKLKKLKNQAYREFKKKL